MSYENYEGWQLTEIRRAQKFMNSGITDPR